MKKTIIVAILYIILQVQTIAPIYTAVAPPIKVVMRQNIEMNILGHTINVSVVRTDTFSSEHLISFIATAEINGTPVVKLITPEYPWQKIHPWQVTQEAQEYSINTYEAQEYFLTSVPSEWKYWWDDILFIKAPGPAVKYVKYDHPDNYDTYFPNEINIDYVLKNLTSQKYHYHLAQAKIEEAKSKADLTIVMGSLFTLAAALLAIPEPLISKIIAAALSVIAAILTVVGGTEKWFLDSILQSELGDGWSWQWGFGSFSVFRWWWQSFGAWRDWPWIFVALAWPIDPEVKSGYNNPMYYYNPFYTKPMTVWYNFNPSKNTIETEIKSAPTSARLSDYGYGR